MARALYLNDPEGEAKLMAVTEAAISGELEPTMVLHGGETLLSVAMSPSPAHPVPGHSAGSVAYVSGRPERRVRRRLRCEMHGAANGFPSYEDPDAYRASLIHLRDEIRPQRMFLGTPTVAQTVQSRGVELDRDHAQDRASGEPRHRGSDPRAADTLSDDGLWQSDSPCSPFEPVAQELGYSGDPALEPSPFFTTMHGYRRHRETDGLRLEDDQGRPSRRSPCAKTCGCRCAMA